MPLRLDTGMVTDTLDWSSEGRMRSGWPLSWTRSGPPTGLGPDRPAGRRPWVAVVSIVAAIALFIVACNVVAQGRQAHANPGAEWLALIEQGRWVDARRAMCNEAAARRALPEADDLAADFGSDIDGDFIDWASVDGTESSVTALITIDGEDHLLSIDIQSNSSGGDDWKVCGYSLRPLG